MIPPQLQQTAEELVKTKIKGNRKGLPDLQAYIHSFRVEQLLKENGLDQETCLAGLLHDIIEDSDTVETELQSLSIPEEVIKLIKLCSHDKTISNHDLQWMLMIINLVKANNPAAWSIKIADVLDNFKESYAMRKERAEFMLQVKIPVILDSSKNLLKDSPIWNKLAELYFLVTETVKLINGELDFITQELDNSLKLPQEITNAVKIFCEEVRSSNYTVRSARLDNAINNLQSTTESFYNGNHELKDIGSLYALVNEAAGNMLSYASKQPLPGGKDQKPTTTPTDTSAPG